MFERVILPPNCFYSNHRLGDSLLINFSQTIHLLLVLPTTATRITGCTLYERDLILPYPSCFLVTSDIIQDKFISLADNRPRFQSGVIGEIVAAPDIVQI